MVDSGTFNRLSKEERSEYLSHRPGFIEAVLNKSYAGDGSDFAEKYKLQNSNGLWYLVGPEDNKPFAGIQSKCKAVIEALFTDAVQNYGR
ncbi:hypothetical protein [Gimesia aquarii]|uniref:Uncharacterized protein n=1 Tax=Gimesia aquarii TaxID=2527964 RepID=A0A517VRI5_9PLAN|nr:hypothetical protein [Gimesia aquarii]QDT95636.1 hypothetical protein V144x_10820 [Gimesia aquarii]